MAGDLQFDKAEAAGGQQALACVSCKQPITDTYYEVGGKIVCPRCRAALAAQLGERGNFLNAVMLGVLATLISAAVWYGVLKATDSEFGILAVIVGLFVGAAVRKGGRGAGGWRYQTLAMFLTYSAIVTSYTPFFFAGLKEKLRDDAAQLSDTTARAAAPARDSAATSARAAERERPGSGQLALGIAVIIALLYAAPLLAGLKSPILLLILGIALYEAWKLNRRLALKLTGPYRVGAAPAAG